jgi:hypothetical protein
MAEVYVKNNDPITTKIFYGGEIIDADDQVTAEVYDITQDPDIDPPIDIDDPILTFNASKIESDFGTYQIYIPFSTTNRQRNLKIVWSYQINGTDVTHEQSVDVVVPYCDFGNAVEDLAIGTDPSDPNYKSYHDLKMAEKYARKIIENFTGQNFYLYPDTFIAYGTDSDILPLPFKLNNLHKLYENDILLIDNISDPEVNNWLYEPIISETGFGLRIDRSSMIDNTVYTANGMVPPSYTSYGAFKKNVRYKVDGRFGWAKVPDNVEQACIQLMGDYFSKDKIWTNKYVKNISTFDWDFEYSSEAYRGTGNAYVDQLLYPYVLTNMVIV